MATVVSCWGWGGNGQLGLGDRDSRIKPQAARALARESVRSVVCGSRCTLALTARGAVFAWGKNDYGQLGTGDTKAQIEPRVIEALAGVTVVAIAARGSHVLALSDSGRVFSWGRGDEGQLGHGDRASLALPQQIAALRDERIRRIATGRSHSVAVSESGRLFTWGSNDDGALGRDSSDASSALPGRVDPAAFLDGAIAQIECGSRHNLALTEDQRVFAWGWGIYGQLGVGDTASRPRPTELRFFQGKKVLQICCGFRHSFVVVPRRLTRRVSMAEMRPLEAATVSRVDVWGWGWNEHGQLGQPSLPSTVLKPVKIDALSSVDLHLLAAGGRHTLCHFGVNATDDDLSHSPLRRARSETDPRTPFRQTYQTLAWGRGSDGELGVGTVMTASRPISLPAFQGSQLAGLSCGWAHSASLGADPGLLQQEEQTALSSWAGVAVSIGDVDAFFGLLVQFIIQILLIFQLLPVQCGFTLAEVTTGIIPAAAATVAIGNVAFGLHAVALQRKEVRLDVTALPDGANTVLVFAYVLSVMAPEFTRTRSAARVWEVGVFAAFMTGLLQILCLPLVAIMRRCIPRAALLSAVAGVSLAFLTMGFAFQVWENPLIALSPLFLVLICLGAGVQLPLHVPTGLGALLLGTCSAFVLFFVEYPMEFTPFLQPFEFDFVLLRPDFSIIFRAMTSGEGWKYLSVVVPMVMVNVMSTLANLETAAAVGDHYDPTASILTDSIVTMIGACLGNPFPTSVYIGQPIYKSLGARVSYVFLTAAAVLLIAFLNAATLIANTVPISCGVGFLLWIGLVVSASSFSHTPTSNTNHGTAVALGIVPALASWAFQLVQSAIASTHSVSASSPQDTLPLERVLDALTTAGVNPSGMIALSQGYLLTSIVLASTMVNIIEREFLRASAWMGVAALLSATGIVHSFEVDGDVVRGDFGVFPGGAHGWAAQYSAAYTCVAAMLLLFHLREGNELTAAPLWRAVEAVGRQVSRLRREWRERTQKQQQTRGEREPLLP